METKQHLPSWLPTYSIRDIMCKYRCKIEELDYDKRQIEAKIEVLQRSLEKISNNSCSDIAAKIYGGQNGYSFTEFREIIARELETEKWKHLIEIVNKL